MSRKEDLERHIRASSQLILEYEDIIRSSENPKEKARSQRVIDEQWEFIKGHLAEYMPLCKHLNVNIPQDIAEIAVRFPELAISKDKLKQSKDNELPMVALDVRHGARIGRLFARTPETHGFRTRELATPLTVDSLRDVNVLTIFVPLPEHRGEPLTQEEVTNIRFFVAHGGGLFLIGLGWAWKDHGNKLGLTMDDFPLNKISIKFRIYFNGTYLDDPRSEFEMRDEYPCAKFDSTSMREHPITEGIHRICSFGMSSTLQVTHPSIPLVWDGNDPDKCVLAAWHEKGQGRVVCLQHEGYFKDQYINEFDNLKLLINIMQWLSQSD